MPVAGYRLLAEDGGHSEYCCKRLVEDWRVITTFETSVVIVVALGRHDDRTFYAELATTLEISAAGRRRQESLTAAEPTAGQASVPPPPVGEVAWLPDSHSRALSGRLRLLLSAACSVGVPHGLGTQSASHDAERERAGRELLAMPSPPGDGPEPDWEDQKRELGDEQWSDGFASLAGAWGGRVKIADDFDELADDLADLLGERPWPSRITDYSGSRSVLRPLRAFPYIHGDTDQKQNREGGVEQPLVISQNRGYGMVERPDRVRPDDEPPHPRRHAPSTSLICV